MAEKNIKKRILFVNHSSFLTGGANDDFERLLKYFSKKKDKYIICGLSPKGTNEKIFSKYCDEWNSYVSGFLPVTPANILDYYGFIKAYFFQKKEINKILEGKKYDLCIINVAVLFWITFWLWKRKFKILIFIRENVQPLFIKKFIYYFLNKFGSYFIAVSDSLEKEFTEITGNHNIKTIYSAIENDQNFSEHEDSFLNKIKSEKNDKIISSNKLKFISVGSVCDRKNQLLILETARLLQKIDSSIIFIFVGDLSDQNYYSKLTEYCKKYNLTENCIFLDQRDKNYIYNLYKRIDGMIISSKSEGLPLVLAESLFFKIPLITTDAGGIKDIIKNNFNGIVIERNKEDLLKAILKISEDKNFKELLIKNGYETYLNKFNLNRNLEEVGTITDKLTGNGNGN